MNKRKPIKISKPVKRVRETSKANQAGCVRSKIVVLLLILIAGLSSVILALPNTPISVKTSQDLESQNPPNITDFAKSEDEHVSFKGYDLDLNKITPFMNEYCYKCHNSEKQKGDVRLDDLPVKLLTDEDAQLWQDALDAVNLGVMVPEEAKKVPSSEELEEFIASLTSELQNARRAFGDSGGRVVLHRLNRREYVNTVYDMLGVTINEKALPQDGLHHGFDTFGQSLYFSSLHFDRYLQTAEKAIRQIIHKGQKPTFKKVKIEGEWKSDKADHQLAWFTRRKKNLQKNMDAGKTFKELRYNSHEEMLKAQKYNQLVIDRYAIFKQVPGHDTGFLPYRVDHPVTQHFKIKIPDVDVEGDYILRVRCGITDFPGGKKYRYKDLQPLNIKDQTINNGEPEDFLRVYDISAPMSEGEIVEYRFRMIPGQQREIDLHSERGVNNLRLWIDWAEWSGPHNVEWPSRGFKNIFFKVEETPKNNRYAREIITNFATWSFRGQEPSKSFIDTLYAIYLKHRSYSSFEESLVLPLASILASPNFIFKFESRGESGKLLEQLELANRLSFFLWSSLPDSKLYGSALRGDLNGAVLASHIDRMLKDPKADRFVESFVSQWLELNKLNALTDLPGDLIYSARQEPIEFFRHLLEKNLSYKNFINSDFIVINKTLAEHYKIDQKLGREFTAVKLEGSSVRGGLIGQAAFMMMTSEGKRTSIVQRGAWVLEKMLNTEPPPPPPNVPQLDPGEHKKILSALELLERHNSMPQCRSCHKRIDPLGYALESFDHLGNWRGNSKFRIDMPGFMPDGKRQFTGLDEFKSRLQEDHERLLKGLVEGLLIYSMGRPLSFNDGVLIDELIDRSKQDDGVRTLVKNIVLSSTFKKK